MFRSYWFVAFAFQLTAVLCFALTELAIFGAVGPFLSIGVLSLAIVGCYVWKASRTEKWPRRQHILPLANRFGWCWSVVSVLAYGVLALSNPQSLEYDLINLFWIVPLLAGAIWLGVSVITLCVGDLIATIYDTAPVTEPGSFRDHPSEYWRD